MATPAALPRTFHVVRWKQLYFLGAGLFLLALAATAYDEAYAPAPNGYVMMAATCALALLAAFSLGQFVYRFIYTDIFTVRADGIDLGYIGFIPWSDMRRITARAPLMISFEFVNPPRAQIEFEGLTERLQKPRLRRNGHYLKTYNCRGLNARFGVVLHTLRAAAAGANATGLFRDKQRLW
jgi:hypothetical protein